MAIPTNTLEQINYIKDLDYSYNIKLFLMLLMIVFAISIQWYSRNKIDRTSEKGDVVYYILNVFGWSFLGFTPMYSFVLLRSVELSILMDWLFISYGIVLSLLTLYVLYWFGEKFLSKYLGINFNDSKRKLRTQKDYRRYD